MPQARELSGTGILTSAVGLGCAGLFRLPWRKDRQAVLHAAFDAGVRHFDTAPMYGFGLADAELGAFLRNRRDQVTVTAKFGIDPGFLPRTLAPLQGPARAVLARRPGVAEGLKTSGKNADSGIVGRLLYRSPGFDRQSARRSLDRTLRALRTDYVDVFLLHDPFGAAGANLGELADYLDEQRKAGRIRAWGVTGPPDRLLAVREQLRWPAVLQYRDDVFDDAHASAAGSARITYGALSRALPALSRVLAASPGDGTRWSERLGVDLTDRTALPRLLLTAALARNADGPVLFSTTSPERVAVAAAAAQECAATPRAAATEPLVSETAAFHELLAAARAATPQLRSEASDD